MSLADLPNGASVKAFIDALEQMHQRVKRDVEAKRKEQLDRLDAIVPAPSGVDWTGLMNILLVFETLKWAPVLRKVCKRWREIYDEFAPRPEPPRFGDFDPNSVPDYTWLNMSCELDLPRTVHRYSPFRMVSESPTVRNTGKTYTPFTFSARDKVVAPEFVPVAGTTLAQEVAATSTSLSAARRHARKERRDKFRRR